ncbi:LysR substrate-binding domain-containing protein [Sulfitobacter sp. F26204]|nr:LysR substrate-binding domain-containing protein [Sulfitobacter sp. F26204]
MVLHDVERIKNDIIGGTGGPSGIVTIAIPPAVGHLLVPALAHLLNETAPNISLRVLGGFSSYIKELLVKGQVDLACTHDPVLQRGFSVMAMLEEEVFIVGKSGSFEFDDASITPERLSQLPLVLPARPNSSRRFLDRWAEPAGLQLDPDVEVDDHMITRGLLEAGVGFAPLTKGAVNRELSAGTLEARPLQPRAYWPLTLMTCISQSRSEAVDHVAEALQTIVAKRLEDGTWIGARSNND